MIVALGGVGQNARAAAAGWIADVVPGELVLTSIRPVAPDEGVVGDITAAVPNLARVSPIATFDVALDGTRTDAAAVVGADMAADGRLAFVAGDRAAALAAIDAGGSTILPAALAERLGVTVGQTLTVPTTDGSSLDLRVAGHRRAVHPGQGRRGDAGRLDRCHRAPRRGRRGRVRRPVRARRAAGRPRGAPGHGQRSSPSRSCRSDRIEGAISDALGRIFGLFDALAAVAVLIAALGIVNTLTMNVIERVREIGILRAAGMTRRQVWRSVVVEAGVLGLAGALLGIVLGLIVGGLMVVMAGGRIDPAAGIPWAVIGLALVLGIAVAMLAAAYPARIASRLSIVRAVQYE